MRKYEVMYIIRTEIEEELLQSTIEKFKGVITNGAGVIEKHDILGKRRLAYEINKHRDGYYVLVKFQADAAVILELDRLLKISEEVIRFLITKDVA